MRSRRLCRCSRSSGVRPGPKSSASNTRRISICSLLLRNGERRIHAHDEPGCADCRQWKDEIEEKCARQQANLAVANERNDFDQGRKARQHHDQRAGPRKALGIEGRKRQRGEGGDVAKGNEDDPCHREDEDGSDRHQRVDCAGGDPVDRKNGCDVARH